jgi:hypothetical protein
MYCMVSVWRDGGEWFTWSKFGKYDAQFLVAQNSPQKTLYSSYTLNQTYSISEFSQNIQRN